jgi:hypothetical protein
MFRKGLLVSSFFLGVALLAPAVIRANPATPQVSIRVYDRDHRDYHNWDDREIHSYGLYRADHPNYNVTFARTSRRQQRDYWRWRHEHPDHD